MTFKTLNNLTGWLTFAIAAVVLGLAAEPTGSLWDCGEFISGAYKLQVVHPPGAPVFLLIGRLFTWVASLFSSNPENIAYAVNLLSALCTAFTALFVCWSTTILSKLALTGRDETPDAGQTAAILGAGLVAGLVTAFTTSIWFSAVEGEVYAMSTFFTALTLWAVMKWYNLPDTADADRWLVFAVYAMALSMGVHLLSLLTFPALALFYYYKKSKAPTWFGALVAAGVGMVFIVVIQSFIIAGIPRLWAMFERPMVNGMGLPFHTGVIPVLLLFAAAIWYGLHRAKQTGNGLLQRGVVAFALVVFAYLSYGMVIIRANANTPINMNDPSDAMRLLPYLNREQYGERPLLYGPHFDAKPMGIQDPVARYGRVGDHYEVVDEKVEYEYAPRDKTLFPRMSDYSQGRPALYRRWIDKPKGVPTVSDHIEFFFKYQLAWMYWRYFMWNFSGRQNGEQGLYAWDPSSGNWITGFNFIDKNKIGDLSQAPDHIKNSPAQNKYYLIPFLLGLIGLFFHAQRRRNDFVALFALFIITGVGIIVYSNQPPNEPRERDYVLAGSFFTFAIWVGMSIPALYSLFSERFRFGGVPAGAAATLLALSAPVLMVTQNWDDHSRANHYASRDYARNFLESCAPDAIIFTYGDNDTYPLWYCQEVENIRTDVRVVNLSLIAVDWYIDQLRRGINEAKPIKLSIPQDKLRGFKRMQTPYVPNKNERPMSLQEVMNFLREDHPVPSQGGRSFETYLPTSKIYLQVDKNAVAQNNVMPAGDSSVVDTIWFDLGVGEKKSDWILKDQLAMLDIVYSNLWERPIYWAVTCREDRLLGLNDYLQLEGLAVRIVPVKSKSESQAYGMVGMGRVETDIAFDNIMNKWKWGNFDNHPTFIDRSYMPSLQTMRVAFIRVGRQLVVEGKKDKAIALADKYFEVFPKYNFPYDQFSSFMADVYARAGAKDKAAEKINDIATSMEQQMQFYRSLPLDMQNGYQQDMNFTMSTMQSIMRITSDMGDSVLMDNLESRFMPLMPQQPGLPGIVQ
ncbi:MAG: DUF2723 domain-containing protein [Saprospiraceae bacterium]